MPANPINTPPTRSILFLAILATDIMPKKMVGIKKTKIALNIYKVFHCYY
jgi:hypothetical protein